MIVQFNSWKCIIYFEGKFTKHQNIHTARKDQDGFANLLSESCQGGCY